MTDSYVMLNPNDAHSPSSTGVKDDIVSTSMLDMEDPRPEATDDPRPEATDDPRPEAIDDPRPEAIDDPRPEATDDPRPEAIDDPRPEATDVLQSNVHNSEVTGTDEPLTMMDQYRSHLAQSHIVLMQYRKQLNARDVQVAEGARLLEGYQEQLQTSSEQLQTATDQLQTATDQLQTATDQLQTATDQLQTATDQLNVYKTWLNQLPSKTKIEVFVSVLGGIGGIDAGHGARLWLRHGISLAGGWHIFVGTLTLASAMLIWKFVTGMPGPTPPLPAT